MDELRGPMIQIVLRIKEGLGFGFLKNPFLVSGSLNGYSLETDVVVPSHAPIFDAELVWEADKRRFRNLRVQNVPIKLEVYTTGSHGRKNKVGYILLSLLAAQPCPTNKLVNVKNSWFRLLGVKSEGKCCQPQLMMALTVEDRVSAPTPRNNLRMFHSNEVAYLTPREGTQPPLRSALQTYNEFIMESNKSVSTAELKPKLLTDEGLIQIGDRGKDLFVLSFVIGCAENIDLLIPEEDKNKKETECYVTYSIFTHNIMTDRARITKGDSMRCSAAFNQRTSLRLCTDLADLSKYFAECPYVITKFCYGDKHVGICSMDLRKLVPTNNIKDFSTFCNNNNCIVIHERCYILSADDAVKSDRRKPYIDVQMSFTHVGFKDKELQQKAIKSSHSASQLTTDTADKESYKETLITEFRSGSCTHFDDEIGRVAYTNSTKSSNRYRNAAGDAVLQSNDITEIIKKMCDTFTENQERLLTCKLRPPSVDMQIQCNTIDNKNGGMVNECKKSPSPRKMDTYVINSPRKDSSNVHKIEKEKIKIVLNEEDRQLLMKKYIDELEDWKEKQQDLYKCQLQLKEEYHLDALSKEWNKRRVELENKLSHGIEQCRNLAADLSQATEEFKLRGYRNNEREKKLAEAKKALEQHFSTKYQELRQASQLMEDDMNHRIRIKDMTIQELETRVASLEKQVDGLQDSLKNCEKEVERKFSGITKDHTTSMLQEMRILEDKLEKALQSKAFFKEQWSRAVRELHTNKLNQRKQLLAQMHQEQHIGECIVKDGDAAETSKSHSNFRMIAEDMNTALESYSVFSERPDVSDFLGSSRKVTKQSTNEKLNELITRRDGLIAEECLDEDKLTKLNEEIRNILLNYGT